MITLIAQMKILQLVLVMSRQHKAHMITKEQQSYIQDQLDTGTFADVNDVLLVAL